MSRNWTKTLVPPEDILDGAKTLGRRHQVMTLDLVPDWVQAEEYLSWARIALEKGGPFGYDAAVCYAKRAVCRVIDSLMHYNHLERWVGRTYTFKILMLKKIGIDVKSVTHELIINNRNDIEHNYSSATEVQARHAVELAEMALPPLIEESNGWALVTLGLNYGGQISAPDPTAPGGYADWNYNWEADIPFLLVDYADPTHRVMMIHRADVEVRYALLTSFEEDNAIELANQMREQQKPGGGMRVGCNRPIRLQELKSRLELTF